MSKKHHDKQLARAREQRRSSKFERRSSRNRTIVLIMAVLLVVSLIAVPLTLALTGGDDSAAAPDDPPDESTDQAADEPETTVGPCGPTPDDVPEVDSVIYDEPFELTIDEDADYVATIETTCGDIVIDLDASAAPLAVNNLVNLAEDGYYDGVIFHRVIPGFVAQVGDPAGTGCGRDECTGATAGDPAFPGYSFDDELGLAEELYDQVRTEQLEELDGVEDEEFDEDLRQMLPAGYPRGSVAMANAGPNTNGSQFFVSQGDPTELPGPQYTVFGTVTEGMDVVDDIVASPVDTADGQNRPYEDVVVRRVTIEQR